MLTENEMILAMVNGATTEHDARRMIRELNAQVWDAGFDAGYGMAWAEITAGYEGGRPNPYRGGQ